MARVSIIEAARAANAFRRANWARAIGPMVLIVIGSTLNRLWQKSAPAPSGLAGLVEVAGWVMAYGALYRLALAEDHPGDAAFEPGRSGFQWRGLEWRLIAVALLGVLIALAAGVLFGVGYVAVNGGVPTGPLAHVSPATVLVGVVVACAAVYVAVRLSMAAPATVDRGQIRFFRTWPLTRGAALAIFGANLLVAAVVLGISLVAVFGGMAIGVLIGSAASFAAAPEAKMGAITTFTGAGAAFGAAVVHAFVGVPLSVGVSTAIYRILRTRRETAGEAET
jgi:hypothetical protein